MAQIKSTMLNTKAPIKTAQRRAGRPASTTDGVGAAAIIEAACELLRELPAEKVTRAEVARRAGVTPRSIHYYFEDRASLLLAAARNLSIRFQADAKRAQPKDASPEERLRSRISALVNFHMRHPYFHRLLTEEVLLTGSSGGAAILHDMTTTALGEYREILEAGVASIRMRSVDIPLLYISVIGMMEMAAAGRPILQSIDYPCDAQSGYVDRFAEFALDLLMNGLRAR